MKKEIGQIAPPFVRKGFRLFRYRNERHKFLREITIRRYQNRQLRADYDPNGEKLIIFLVPGSDWATGKDKISGGAISIVSICEETAGLKDIHGAQTILCTMNDDHLFLKHTQFQNKTAVYRFEQLVSFFGVTKQVIIHIPEFLTSDFMFSLKPADRAWLAGMKSVHFNILNQNIKLMPDRQIIGSLEAIAKKVTITTAHQKYCTEYYRQLYGVPIHKLSVWISPEQYAFINYPEKENLLVVSPDPHPMKENILSELGKISGLTIQIIRNLTYEQFKELIGRAKWSLTFGEGLDGYLIEPVFSGAVAFAVYNEDFFTPDFSNFQTIYPSYDSLMTNISGDMAILDNAGPYAAYQNTLLSICAKYYSREQYKKNIAAFYKAEYTLNNPAVS